MSSLPLRVRRGLPLRAGRGAAYASSYARLGPSTVRRRGRSQSTVRHESRSTASLSAWRIGWRGRQGCPGPRGRRGRRVLHGAVWRPKCRVGGFRLGRTPSRTSPAGLVCRYPWATIQAPIRLRRCRRLRASLGFEFQRGSSTPRT